MPRYRAILEYDGAPFSGFQSQAGGTGVQDALESAIGAFSRERPRVFAAGRTDAGVHAAGQAIHFDLEKSWPANVVGSALNAHLAPRPIAVLSCEIARGDFHARFSAKGRTYLYRILDRPAPPALDRGRVWWLKARLDEDAMAKAAEVLVGRHDFTTFRDAACQALSPVKTLDLAEVWRKGEEVRARFCARSFLHRQVRSMVGSLVEVGRGRWRPADFREALEAADRRRCGPVAPPEGLTLLEVDYGEKRVK
ncbi:MAG: tRNA pseudouridine(38-40) synthase TruA [Caulobacteraceae bacterium]